MDKARDNLCPECNGCGLEVIGSWQYDDWIETTCPACNGDGVLTAIPTEDETARNPHRLNEYMLSTERQYGRDVLTFAWPIQPR